MSYLNLFNSLKTDIHLRRLTYVFIILVIGKFLLTLPFKTPWIIADEIVYADIAKNIWLNHSFTSNLEYSRIYPPGYSLILSISYIFVDKNIIYHSMLLINTILTSLILFPSYLISKKFVNENLAFWLAILIAISPSNILYNFELMSENLFNPLFLFSVYFLMESLKTNNKLMSLLAGGSTAYLFLTRSIGIAVILSFFIIVIYYALLNKNLSSIIKSKFILIFSLLCPLIIWTMSKIISKQNVFIRLKLESNQSTAIVNSITGYPVKEIYFQILSDAFSNWDNFILFVRLFINEIDYIIVSTFFIFFVFTTYAVHNMKGIKNKFEFNILVLYTFLCSLFFLIITVTHMYGPVSQGYQTYNLFGRYIDPIIPLFYILGGIGIELYNVKSYSTVENKSKSYFELLLISFSLFIVMIVSFPYPNYKFANVLPIWYIQYAKDFIPVIVFFIIFLIIILVYLSKRNMHIIFAFVCIFSLISIVTPYQRQIELSDIIENQNQIGRWLKDNDNSASITSIDCSDWDFKDKWDPNLFFVTQFWMNGKLICTFDIANINKNVEYIISSKFLPYEDLTSNSNYRLYGVYSIPNFKKPYIQSISKGYIIDIGMNDTNIVSNFWDPDNNWARWTKNTSDIKMLYPKADTKRKVTLYTEGNRPKDNAAHVKLSINGYPIANFTKESGALEYSFEIPENILNPAYQILTIETNTWNPGNYGSNDQRELGIEIDRIKIERLEV